MLNLLVARNPADIKLKPTIRKTSTHLQKIQTFKMSSTIDTARQMAQEVASVLSATARSHLTDNRIEDFDKAKELATSAAKSGAYLYPIKVHNSCVAFREQQS